MPLTKITGDNIESNINVGIISATNITAAGVVTATSFVGSGANLTGIAGTANVRTNSLVVSGVSTFSSITGVSTAGITTVYIGSVNDGPLSGLRNRIINGNFDVWQRGTSISMSASSVYTIDRWITGGTGTTSRQTFTLGQTEVPGNPKYYAQYDISSNSQNYEFTQKIEGVETFAGEQVTLSFYARRTSGTINIGTRLVQYFGTGGSPSGTVVTSISGGNLSLTSSWQKFVFTASVPSISGKTIGSNNDDSLWVSFQINDTNTGTLQFAQVQLERGSVATPFERKSYGDELRLCQRYYQQGKVWGFVQNDSATNATQGGGSCINFATQMRAAPTVTSFSGSAFTAQSVDVNGFGIQTTGGQNANSTTNATYAAAIEL
jgi:hypothetical protein